MEISAKANEILNDIRTKVAEYAKQIIRDSERSGNTPTEDQLNSILGQYTGQLMTASGYPLNDVEINMIRTSINNFNKTSIIPTYRSSLISRPREVNGQFPDAVTDKWHDDAQKKYIEVRDKLSKKMSELMQESIRTGKTPTKDQVNAYLQTVMQELVAEYGNTIDEATRTYIRNYSLPWIENTLVNNVYDRSLQLVPREITGEFPWTPSDPNKPLDTVPNPKEKKKTLSKYHSTNTSFSGADMVCTVDIALPDGTKAVKVIGSLQTISYSIHQEKQPVRAIGNMNAKDYVFGPRTIAGTLIFAVFNNHWAYEIMNEYRKAGDLGSTHFLMDELPPFQITISAGNEYGIVARLALYGVRIVNEGQVMAINDVFTENSYQFVASDLDYLTDATGYIKPKAIRVPPIEPMINTPLPETPPVAAIPVDDTTPSEPSQPETAPSEDPPKPTDSPQTNVSSKPYGNMTEQQVINQLEEERKTAIAAIDQKMAAGEYKSKSEANRVKKAYNETINKKIAAAKQYFDEQKE